MSILGAFILLTLVGLLIYLGKVVLLSFWTELAVALVVGAIALLAWGFKPLFDKDVSLKIKSPRMEVHKPYVRDEVKSLFLDIRNNGKIEARGCQAKIKVVGKWDEFETLLPDFPSTVETFNVLAKDKRTICLCQVRKQLPTTTVIHIARIGTYPALTKGIYDLDLRIVGENFANRKTHKLQLDISSWENIGIALDC